MWVWDSADDKFGVLGTQKIFTKMKFSLKPPFISKTGKLELSRSLPSLSKKKDKYQQPKASYKRISNYNLEKITSGKEFSVRVPEEKNHNEDIIVDLKNLELKNSLNESNIEIEIETVNKKSTTTEEKSLPRSSITNDNLFVDDKEKIKKQSLKNSKLVSSDLNKKKEGVSGTSSDINKSEKASEIKLPVYEKDEENKEIIKDAIRGNEFLKDGLFANADIIEAVVDALYLKHVKSNTQVIREGEVGSHMYVIAKGSIDVLKQNKKVNTLGPRELFGELALLYNSKRNATIIATTDCSFWVLDRKVFLQIMKKFGMQMTENKVKFLKSVPLLSSLSTEILTKITDLLQLQSFPGGSVIIRQGDEGSLFYIITGGSVSVTITQPDGSVVEYPSLKTGDFFGEKALLQNDKRAATITAQEPGVECLTLNRTHFIEYLGGLQEVQLVAAERSAPVEEILPSEYENLALEDLEIIGTLGVGAFGRVEFVRLKDEEKKVFALKKLKKVDVVDLGQEEHVINEKDNMKLCRSPFIVRLYKTYKSKKYLYFLMEMCQGGDVWSLLQKRKFFDETLAKFIMACMVEAFDYLHSRGIVYRDLKPENVLFSADGYAKLGDFGFSKKLKSTEKTWTFAGTPEYLAPEIILNKGHNRAVDYWTLGIFLHELLVGKPPFRGRSHSHTYTLILKGIDSVKFPKFLDEIVQTLIKKLCRHSAVERLGYQRNGLDDIRQHRWFKNFKWEFLQNTTMKAPYKPKLNGVADLTYFDKCPKDKDIPPDTFGDWDDAF